MERKPDLSRRDVLKQVLGAAFSATNPQIIDSLLSSDPRPTDSQSESGSEYDPINFAFVRQLMSDVMRNHPNTKNVPRFPALRVSENSLVLPLGKNSVELSIIKTDWGDDIVDLFSLEFYDLNTDSSQQVFIDDVFIKSVSGSKDLLYDMELPAENRASYSRAYKDSLDSKGFTKPLSPQDCANIVLQASIQDVSGMEAETWDNTVEPHFRFSERITHMREFMENLHLVERDEQEEYMSNLIKSTMKVIIDESDVEVLTTQKSIHRTRIDFPTITPLTTLAKEAIQAYVGEDKEPLEQLDPETFFTDEIEELDQESPPFTS